MGENIIYTEVLSKDLLKYHKQIFFHFDEVKVETCLRWVFKLFRAQMFWPTYVRDREGFTDHFSSFSKSVFLVMKIIIIITTPPTPRPSSSSRDRK